MYSGGHGLADLSHLGFVLQDAYGLQPSSFQVVKGFYHVFKNNCFLYDFITYFKPKTLEEILFISSTLSKKAFR